MSLKTIKCWGALLVAAAAMAVCGGEAADYTGGNIGVKGWKLPVTDEPIANPTFRASFSGTSRFVRTLCFDVTANNQTLAKPFDLYKEVGGDINKATAIEKDVTVGADGLLLVRFVHVPGKGRDPCGQSAYPCVRFVNAIEVLKK